MNRFFRFVLTAVLAVLAAGTPGIEALHADSITIRYPNGGEQLKTGTPVQIKWVSQPAKGNVVLILYKKGIKHSVISKGTPNNGGFTWKIPGNLPAGNDYRLRIRLKENLSINDFSDRNFAIK
ncbi:MAG: hypothetical protein GY950_23600 [bacterium]|nr:hypothetical protein [bacterium]